MNTRSSKLHLVTACLIIGIALLLGWFSQRYNHSIDVTANARHSLAESTVTLLQSMQSPVELIAVLPPNVQQSDGVRTLVEKFQEVKPDIELRFVNPETDPAQARELEAAPGGELILRTGTREQRLQSLSERSLANSLQQLTLETAKDIVFVTGHAERSPINATNDDWLTISERLANIGLVSREQSLISDPVISATVDLLVIAAPKMNYFPGELASINNYLQAGGNLLWLIEPSNNDQVAADLSLLSNTLGVDVLPGVVIDTASQALSADSPDFVLLDRFPAHPITRVLSSPVLIPQAAALAVSKLAGQEVTPLLQTPDSSWTETGPLSGAIRFNTATQEVAGPLLLGVTIERNMPSGVQRFAVIGDADFAASQFIGNGGNKSFAESLMLWLTGEADALSFVTQRAADSELQLSNRSIVGITLTFLVVLPSFFLILAGFVRWQRGRDV